MTVTGKWKSMRISQLLTVSVNTESASKCKVYIHTYMHSMDPKVCCKDIRTWNKS
jgi:hypothetical protein